MGSPVTKATCTLQIITHERNFSRRTNHCFKTGLKMGLKTGLKLQDILVHKKQNKVLDRNNDNKCKKCSICEHITSKIKFTKSDKTFTFNQHINCKTSNIVYGIYCNKCNEINYVGETGTTIYERFQNHISSM